MSNGTQRRALRDHRREVHPDRLTCASCVDAHKKLQLERAASRRAARTYHPER